MQRIGISEEMIRKLEVQPLPFPVPNDDATLRISSGSFDQESYADGIEGCEVTSIDAQNEIGSLQRPTVTRYLVGICNQPTVLLLDRARPSQIYCGMGTWFAPQHIDGQAEHQSEHQ